MRSFVVYRTAARDTKLDIEKVNYNAPDEVQFEGVEFSDGKVAQRWMTTYGSVAVWDSMHDLKSVHIYAHPDYGTRIVWDDGEVEEL